MMPKDSRDAALGGVAEPVDSLQAGAVAEVEAGDGIDLGGRRRRCA